ncbi:MAG: metallophosphoesterase family protein, partial [Oscillospiraceae bacterium]|nr:metallophosphoesterase family protein [Oscillospiraceae bacterium]
DILLHGHTHVPAFEKTDMCIYLNPGSVSIPKENSAHGYMAIYDDRIEYKDLDGNTYRTVLKSEI